jgi:uncharacterized membrane protein
MASWKKINEVGGAVILRTVTGLFACLGLYGLVTIAQNGRLTVGKLLLLVAFVALFGGYTAVGNRMDRFVRWWEWLRTPGKK